MILLTSLEDVNKYWDMVSEIEDELDTMAPKFMVLRTHEVEAMVFSLTYHEAGEALRDVGYDYIVPIFNELPDALQACQHFRYPIAVLALKDRGLISGDCGLSER